MLRPFISALLLAIAPATAWCSNCNGTSTGMIPLTDLGAGSYHGYPGGLYGNGLNTRPPAHDSAGIAIANAIVPLDTLGHPDPNGWIVMVSIGMSNCTQEFSTFIPIANADSRKNPRVLLIDCAEGGQSADLIRDPTVAYWDTVRARLREHRSTPAQVQVFWSKEADREPTGGFPASAESLSAHMLDVVHNTRALFPNLRLGYLTSRIYAGYATSSLNPEPYAYESGFAFKWLIDSQIAGSANLNYDPGRGPVEACWLSWGPYLWADGLTARSDGLTWQCSDFVTSDGTHPSNSGRMKVADSLLAFLERDPSATPWFLTRSVDVPRLSAGTTAVAVAPNPTRATMVISFTPPVGQSWSLELVDLAGRKVAELGSGVGEGVPISSRWTAAADRRPRAGVYWIQARAGGQAIGRRSVVLAP